MTTDIATPIRAWHFVGATLRDGRPIPPDGEWLVHEGPLDMCKAGLHASRHPFDALQYAPGETLCLVDMDGEIYEGDDKLVARRRRIVARVGATELLRAFARQQALGVIHLWPAPDVVRDYLQTGNPALRTAAKDAAWDVAMDAARDAAWAAARDSACDAARGAASDAARDAFLALVTAAFAEKGVA
jgi:hypothetical protein